jgi:hypothetical protein
MYCREKRTQKKKHGKKRENIYQEKRENFKIIIFLKYYSIFAFSKILDMRLVFDNPPIKSI